MRARIIKAHMPVHNVYMMVAKPHAATTDTEAFFYHSSTWESIYY